ncbi:MAG: potassium transporter KtrB [Clostridia bacterium]|nr:potassium transporter KtrB [Clostridia bacterium]
MKVIEKRKVAQTTKITILSFLALVFIGGFLLNLPICNAKETTFLDSLFTSAASVCVAGLSTVTAAEQFTLIGKIIMLCLIQIGALGFIILMAAFYMFIKRKISYKEQLMIGATIGNEGNLDTTRNLIRRVVKYTAIVEIIGAIVLCFRFIPMFGVAEGIGQSIFTSVSAFCNCGYDILGPNSLKDFATDYLVLGTCGILTLMGSLGFIVWNELIEKGKEKRKYKLSNKKMWLTLSVHTKLVLIMTVVMIVVGTLGFVAIEYGNELTLGRYNFGEKLFISLFHGISARTTGMAAIDLMSMSDAGKLFTAILMFIGGAPGSTAGGIKTVTFAVLLLTMLGSTSGNRNITVFDKEVQNETIKKALTVIILALIIVCTMSMVLSILNPEIEFINIMFETISALATCGYSLGITASLTTASKVLLILIMFIGRVSTVTMAMALTGKKFKHNNIVQYPKADINVG